MIMHAVAVGHWACTESALAAHQQAALVARLHQPLHSTDMYMHLLQAGHALIGALMPEYDPVTKISIVPRGAAGGLTFFAPSDERLDSGLYR